MSNLSTLPKGDSAWLLRKAIERIIQQVSVLETNIGASTTGNSANTQVIFNDNGTLRGDPDLTFNKALNKLVATNLESTTTLVVGTTATITGDLTVATDRLKVVTGSTAVQIGATTQTQIGTTAWPSTVIGKSGSRALFGNEGTAIFWNEAAAVLPVTNNYASTIIGSKTAVSATTVSGVQIRGGIENATDQAGYCSFLTSPAGGGFLERYKIDSTGISTWSVAGTTAMTLNSTGLGIGTASHSVKLGVVDTVNTFAATFRGSSSTNFVAIGTTALGASINGFTAAFAATADLVLQPNGGNVGIGVTPSVFTVGKVVEIGFVGNALFGATVGQFNMMQNAYFNGAFKYANTAAASYYQQLSGQHLWYNAPSGTAGNNITFTQAMTLDASGRLGIGTATMAEKLTIDNNLGGSAAGLRVYANDQSTARIAVQNTNGQAWHLVAGYAGANNQGLSIFDATTSANRLYLDTSGNANIINGNLIIGTSGKGIDFSATASGSGTGTSEVLDDYEEGTFTPTILGNTIAGVGVYVNQVGKYTKIGNQVTVWVNIEWSAHTGTGTQMYLGGLPFAVTSLAGYNASAAIGYINNISLTAGNFPLVLAGNSDNYARFFQSPTGGGAATTVPIDTAGQVVISMTYNV